LRELVESDPYLTTREMAHQLGVVHGTIENGLQRLGKVRKLGRWIPHQLTE
jgi:histone-lysine N-methyltransferase SETMAR